MSTKTEIKDFIITREFAAPRDLVWKCWTEKEHLCKWMSPVGFDMVFTNFNFKVGGDNLFSQRSLDGIEMWAKWEFIEIEINKKLIILISITDKKGKLAPHAMVATWPQRTLSTTTFEEKNGKTIVNLKWTPFQANEESLATFNGSIEGMKQAWGATFTKLDKYIEGKKI